MKNIKNTLLVGAVALGLASSASATTYLRITGSTANGDATHTAILNVLTNTAGNSLTSYAYETAALKGSKVAIFSGNISGIGAVIIKTKLTGSEAGIQTTVQGYNVAFLNDTNLPVSGSTSGLTSAGETDVTAPGAALSDTFQSTSRFAAGATVTQTNGAVTYTALTPATITGSTNGIVGVVPFKFVATSDAPFTNITTRLAQDLWSGGKVKLSGFTGNLADNNKFVYATGRDIDSGTRLTCMLAIGFSANGQVKQYQPSTSANAQITSAATANGATNNKLNAFPAGTINNVAVAIFNNGYNSGGNLVKALAASATNYGGTAGVAAIVGYAGANDSDPQTTNSVNPLKELAFEGVYLGSANGNYNTNAALINGLYNVWGYEHLYFSAAVALDANASAIGNAIATQLFNTDAVVRVSSMTVSRAGDGGAITY